MAAPTPKSLWQQYFRLAIESSFGTSTAAADWNIGGNLGGATGWRDIPVVPGSVRTNPSETQIFLEGATGKRAMNQQPPVPGEYENTGTFEMPWINELVYPILRMVMGGVANVETAGTAALASTIFASVATLDTQPDGTEQLKFVIASSTAASAATIDIIQSAVTVETITIGTSASSVDGDYYSKGAYDGSVNAITFSIGGTVTSGTVVVSGVDYTTNTFTMATTNPTAKLEEAGQPKSASNSGYYTGSAFTDFVLSFDKTALDGMLMLTTNFASQFFAPATAGAFGNDAAKYYHPLAGATFTATKDGSAFDKIQAMTLTVNGGNQLFRVASGDQNPAGISYGPQSVTCDLTVLPEDATEFNDWAGQTVGDFHFIITSPQNIVDSTPWLTTIELTKAYVESYAESAQQDVLFGAEMTLRTIEDATDGIIKIANRSRMPT